MLSLQMISAAYDPIHPPGTIEEYLPKDKHLGQVNPKDLKQCVRKLSDS